MDPWKKREISWLQVPFCAQQVVNAVVEMILEVKIENVPELSRNGEKRRWN